MSERVFALPVSRRVARALLPSLALALLSLFVLPASTAEAGRSTHPYFNDRGTLDWHVRYADAQREARRTGKLIFVEAGRRSCSMCNKFCREVLPSRAVCQRIARIAVGYAAEIDHPEAAITPIVRTQFAKARMLPLVWFMTPDGRFVAGFWGKRTVQEFTNDLATAEAAWRRQNAPSRRAAATPCAPAPRAAPRAPQPAPPCDEPVFDPLAEVDGCEEVCEGGCCRLVPRKAAPAAEPAPTFPAPTPAPQAQPGTEPEPTLEPLIADNGPAPRTDAVRASGSPDAEPVDLPEPVVRPAERLTARPATTHIRPAAKNRNTVQRAQEAAARGQWGRVLGTVGANAARDPQLLRLARQAHQWAHERLEEAVRHLAEGRTADARRAVDEVKGQMAGHTEAEDARRGLEAIEFVEDLAYLAESSAVRRAVRRSAYEKLRGSRWARLFRD